MKHPLQQALARLTCMRLAVRAGIAAGLRSPELASATRAATPTIFTVSAPETAAAFAGITGPEVPLLVAIEPFIAARIVALTSIPRASTFAEAAVTLLLPVFAAVTAAVALLRGRARTTLAVLTLAITTLTAAALVVASVFLWRIAAAVVASLLTAALPFAAILTVACCPV